MAAQPNHPNASQAAPGQANIQTFYNGRSSINGIGSFARVGILRGHLIHSERPFLYLLSDEYPVSPQDPRDLQWQTWLGLRPPGMSLTEIFRSTSIRCGVRRRNNQQMEISGVFLRAVRFNSSCQPNVHAHWNETGRCMEFRALRDIAVDEELCFCYDTPTLLYSTVERRQRLLTKFGFHCKCTACSESSTDSDKRRTELRRTIEAGVPTPPNAQAASTSYSIGSNPTHLEKVHNCINQITDAISKLRDAGLRHYADTLYYDLHLARKQAGDTNNAMLCLLTARNLACAMVGRDDPRVGQMTGMLRSDRRNDYNFGL